MARQRSLEGGHTIRFTISATVGALTLAVIVPSSSIGASVSTLHHRAHSQRISLHRWTGAVTFFHNRPWLARTTVGKREVHRARVWVRVIRRELAETVAALRPRPHGFGAPSWWLAAADCVHRHESIDWYQRGTFSGGMQFLDSTWHSVGGSGRAADHSPAEQLYRAYLLWRSQGWSPWPQTSRMCGLA